MRLIDADALIANHFSDTHRIALSHANKVWMRKIINDAPTIEERKTGKWIHDEDEYCIDGYHCNECGFFVPWDYIHKSINYIEDYRYCPNCGVKMER